MANIGDAFSTSLPAVGASGPSYATDINAILTETMARLTAKIPFSSLLLNEDLDMNAQAILNAAYVTLENESASPVASPLNRIAAYAGDLWWVGPSGALQMTTGAALNSAALGGFTGDYGGLNPAQAYFSDADLRYDFYDDYVGNIWAYIRAGGFDLVSTGTPAVRARLAYGGTGNVTYTLPAAAPATTMLLQVSAAGAITASNTIVANSHVTVSGLGRFKHGALNKVRAFRSATAQSSVSVVTGSPGTIQAASTDIWYYLDGLDDHEKLLYVTLDGAVTALATNYTLYTTDGLGGAFAAVAGATTSTVNAQIVLTPTTPALITGHYMLRVTTLAASPKTLYSYTITYDVP